MKSRAIRLVILVGAFICIAACSDDKNYSESCVSGATQECFCEPGVQGVQYCGDDGSWGECDCSDGGADTDTDTDTDTGNGNLENGCNKVDILFVIDNSDSMSEEQTALIAAFPSFVDTIEAYEVLGTGGQLDYHIGVTSTAVDHNQCGDLTCPLEEEEDGVLQDTPVGNNGNCTPPPLNYMVGPDPAVKDQFACVAALGTLGWPFEMPLEAIRRGMTVGFAGEGHADSENSGFLRDDALFVAIIITDEDDVSRADTYPTNPLAPTPAPASVDAYVDAFLSIKDSYDKMVFGLISGPYNTECNGGSLGGADASPRLHEFLGLVGDNAAWGDICSDDLDEAFADILDTIGVACDEMPIIE